MRIELLVVVRFTGFRKDEEDGVTRGEKPSSKEGLVEVGKHRQL